MSLESGYRTRTTATVALLGVCCLGGVGVAAAQVGPLAQPIAMDYTVSPAAAPLPCPINSRGGPAASRSSRRSPSGRRR
jgi:hypothetical protein